MGTEKKVVSVKAVVEMFDAGTSRADIKAHFGLTIAEMTQLFQHPALKNRRQTGSNKLEIVDDYVAPEKPVTKKASKATIPTEAFSAGVSAAPTTTDSAPASESIPPQAAALPEDSPAETVNAEEVPNTPPASETPASTTDDNW